MGVSVVVAVTDGDWFETLRRLHDLAEVNFWSPTPRNFRALEPGELFLFKLRAPYNIIVGGGIFAYANSLPSSLAWEAFGAANGAHSLREMRERILKHRRQAADSRDDFAIGCRILTQPFFFPEDDWIPVPRNWARNIVSYETYHTDETEGLRLWESVADRLARRQMQDIGSGSPRFGKPHTIRPRLGQGAFRVLVPDNYQRRCAVTQERTLPALDAAHIHPYGEGGTHEPENGLLLRRDIHRLFDDGYVTITPSLRFEVSPRIREEFENGRDYYQLDGKQIAVPQLPSQRPDPNALAWHNEHCFL